MKLMSRLVRQRFLLNLVAFGVFANGLIIVLDTLPDLIGGHGYLPRVAGLTTSLPLLEGLTLIYLATLLRRRKRNAWLVVLPVYAFTLATAVVRQLNVAAHHHLEVLGPLKSFLLPAIVVLGLVRYRDEFKVKSDTRSFTLAVRTSLLVLIIALGYGMAGFLLLDSHDFHQEISGLEAFHRTIDQFDLTTNHELHPFSRRGSVFLDSLSVISTGAVLYAFLAFFQPLRARLTDQSQNREIIRRLLERYPASSEDYFKLWPEDKLYYINRTQTAALAYHVYNGVALVVGDPVGKRADFPLLVNHFQELCTVNDWLPAFIHTDPLHNQLYGKHDYSLQKIGEEAVVELAPFFSDVADNKYFRQINNKFTKQGYTTELLQPPHNAAVLHRLHEVSSDWLSLPGRVERGFMMGYFTNPYMQACPLMVLRDAAGTIQAFINLLPSTDPHEANYDLLRHTKHALTNSNDFLLVNFMRYTREQGFKRVNLGLCPLAGLDTSDEEQSTVNNLLKFVYANGDRLYSFSGLYRFKAKYDPEWSPRYVAYKGGVRGFTRTAMALNKAMNRRST